MAGVIATSKLLPGMAIFAALIAALWACGADRAIALAVAVPVFVLSRNRMTQDRPELFAITLLLVIIWLLLRDRRRAQEGHPDRVVFWAIPIAALWANLHASFPLGVAAVLAFAAAQWADELLRARDARARLARAAGVMGGIVVAAWLATLSPPAFSLPAAAAFAAVTLLFAADGAVPLFETSDLPSRNGPLRLLALAAAMTGAVILNPQWAEIYLFPFEFTAGVNTVTQHISEWQPLLQASSASESLELSLYLVFLATWAAALALAAARGCLGRLELALLLVFGILPLRHMRWMALFALATAPALAATLTRARAAAHEGVPATPARRAVSSALAVAGLAALCGCLYFNVQGRHDLVFTAVVSVSAVCAGTAVALAAWPRSNRRIGMGIAGAVCAGLTVLALAHGIPGVRGRRFEPGFQLRGLGRVGGRLAISADSIAFMRRHAVSGRLLTKYDWAGYAIHELWPAVRVFLDSRSEVYGDELLSLLLEMRNQPESTRRALREYDVDLVLAHYRPAPFPNRMKFNAGILDVVENNPDWGLLYLDDGAALYARRDASRANPLPPFLEGLQPRRLTQAALSSPNPALEAILRRARDRAPQASILRFALASLLHARGADAEARRELEAAWEANPLQPAAPFLAAELAEARGADEAARRWYERALEAAPGWVTARRRLRSLQP
jgi:tetratricopeptide (TPR) repeat protein